MSSISGRPASLSVIFRVLRLIVQISIVAFTFVLPQNAIPVALLMFKVCVEFGQLHLVAGVLTLPSAAGRFCGISRPS